MFEDCTCSYIGASSLEVHMTRLFDVAVCQACDEEPSPDCRRGVTRAPHALQILSLSFVGTGAGPDSCSASFE